MEYALSLFIGIFRSLLATALFISLSEFFRRVVLPWYADRIYRGIRVDGTWICEGTPDSEAKLVLEQKGDRITGVYSHGAKSGEKNSVTRYKFEGTLKDAYLSGTAFPESKYMLDSVVFILRIYHPATGNGLTLGGKALFLETNSGEIKTCDEDFKLKEEA